MASSLNITPKVSAENVSGFKLEKSKLLRTKHMVIVYVNYSICIVLVQHRPRIYSKDE
jgi:hypothetical protein